MVQIHNLSRFNIQLLNVLFTVQINKMKKAPVKVLK